MIAIFEPLNDNQNPNEASSRSWIFLFTLVNKRVCTRAPHSWPNGNTYRPEIWYTHSPRPYPKTDFWSFEKVTLRPASLEKLPCHVDFPHISSIA